MTSVGTGQSPRISNPEFQTFRLNRAGAEKCDAIRVAFDRLLNEVKDVLPENNSYLRSVKIKLERACMDAVKGICTQSQNQE